MGDSTLEKFRLEYEKLHRALKKSHDQEKRLVKKCRELNSEIVNNQAKIKTALRLSQEDQKTIANLQVRISVVNINTVLYMCIHSLSHTCYTPHQAYTYAYSIHYT